MCNTNDDGGSGGGGGGGGGDLSPTSSVKKNHKLQKVPKRGPGVAELEKILRQQQDINKTTSDNNNNNNSNNNNHNHNRLSPFLLSSPSDIEDYLQQPHHQRYYPNLNKDINDMNSLPKSSQFRGGMFLPEQIKVNPFSCPAPPLLEHPSSQRLLRNHSSIGQENQKFVSMKRSISVENHYQLADLHPSQRQRLDKQIGLGFSNLNLCKPIPSNSREMNYLDNYNTELVHGVPSEANLVKFVPPNSSPIMIPFQAVQHQFPKFDLIPLQAQRLNGSDSLNKPYYMFFPSNDRTVTEGGSMFELNKIEKGNNQAGQDGIDLDLKLSSR